MFLYVKNWYQFDSMKKTILFVPSNGNHVKIFSNLLEHFQKKLNTLFVTQGSYKNEGAEKELQQLGLNFEEFDKIQTNSLNFLECQNVAAVIVGNDTDIIPQLFINSATKLKIPSILIQDGLMFDVIKNKIPKQFTLKLFLLEIKLLISKQYHRVPDGKSSCTQIHVWGKTSQKYFIKKGIPRKKIIITGAIGNWLTDDMVYNSYKTNTILMAPSNIINSKLLSKKKFEELFDIICTVIQDNSMSLTVKPHPNDDKKFFSKLVNKHATITTLLDAEKILLEKYDALITDFSTIGIQALHKKIPVIIYFPNLSNYVNSDIYPLDLINSKIFMHAKNQQELSKHLKSISNFKFDSVNLNKILNDYLGPADNDSSKRSASYILNLLNQ